MRKSLLSGPIRLRSFALILIASLIAGYAALAALPHDPYVRYQSFKGTLFTRLGWIYDRIHHDPAPIDIVFLGSSRTGAGVVVPTLEAAVAPRCGPTRIANFALPAAGMDVRLTLLNELLTTKRPKLVVIDVTERLPRDGHQAFADLARPSEILSSPWLINRNLPASLIRLPVRQVQLAAATLAPEAFGYTRNFNPSTYAGTSIRLAPAEVLNEAQNPFAAVTDPNQRAAMLAADSQSRRAALTPPLLGGRIEPYEFGVSRHYIKAIAARARTSGAQVAFIFLPFYNGPEAPLDAAWLRTIAPIWSVPDVSTNPDNYIDTAHLGPRPERQVQAWLASQIAATPACSPK